MASIQKRIAEDGKVGYRVRVRLKGQPLQTETFSRLTDAKRWAQKVETAIREGRYFKEEAARKHTLAELIDRYIADVLPLKPNSHRDQLRELLWWKEQLGANALTDVTPALIVECRDKLSKGLTPRGTVRSPATVNRYLAALSHAFTIAIRDWQWLENNPIRKVTRPREPRGRVRFLDEQERECLFEACQASENPALYPAVVVAISTGMRSSEIMNLTWDDVDLDKGRMILHKTKNGERRSVPLARKAKEVLAEYGTVRRLDTRLLFPSEKKPLQPVLLTKAWRTAIKATGIEDFHFHDLRHCTASYLAMSGATLAEIAEVLGHKTLAMVKRYAHLSESHTAGVVERMSEKFLG